MPCIQTRGSGVSKDNNKIICGKRRCGQTKARSTEKNREDSSTVLSPKQQYDTIGHRHV